MLHHAEWTDRNIEHTVPEMLRYGLDVLHFVRTIQRGLQLHLRILRDRQITRSNLGYSAVPGHIRGCFGWSRLHGGLLLAEDNHYLSTLDRMQQV